MIYAANAIEERDSRKLYNVIDERARHALHSIVADRRAAAERIREAYPEELRPSALRALGDGAEAEDAEGLFALRCGEECRDDLGTKIGGVERTEEQGDLLVVHTARGEELTLYRREEGHWWGMVWHTEELDRERSRASQDLRRVEANATTYERRQRLEGREAPPAVNGQTMDPAGPNG